MLRYFWNILLLGTFSGLRYWFFLSNVKINNVIARSKGKQVRLIWYCLWIDDYMFKYVHLGPLGRGVLWGAYWTLSYRALWHAQTGKTSTALEKHSKELNILFIKLIHDSECDFFTLIINIYLQEKKSWNDINDQNFWKSGDFWKFQNLMKYQPQITQLIVISIAPLTELLCNCPLLKDVSFNIKCSLIWCY